MLVLDQYYACPLMAIFNIQKHIINNLSQVDLVFPQIVSSCLVPRIRLHSAVGIPVITARM